MSLCHMLYGTAIYETYERGELGQVSICSNKHHVSEADPLTVAQRWLWAGKYQLKKGKNI